MNEARQQADSAPAGYRRLRVWHDAVDLSIVVYELTARFPRHELFGLASQMQRAAVSIPANIAEGNTRHHTGEYLHHISIARASLAELETHLEIARRLEYVSPDTFASITSGCADVGRQLNSLRHFLDGKRARER